MSRDIGLFHFLSTSFILNVELGGLVADEPVVSIAARSKVHGLLFTAVELEVRDILLVLAFGGDDLHEFHLHSREIMSI